MKLRHVSCFACLVSASTSFSQMSVSTDLWDFSQGAIVTASSEIHPAAGTVGGLLGQNGQANSDESTFTYYADDQPDGTVHFVEWEMPADVTIGQIRVFAYGDFDGTREFEQVTIKAKSPGSDTYDLTLLTYAPGHPYQFIDFTEALVIDEIITPVTARAFRAEFLQYTAHIIYNGPRVLEIDGLPVPPPPPPPPVNVPSVASDVFDVTQGVVITATSGINAAAGSSAGLFGENGQDNTVGSSWTYFNDGQPDGFTHFVEFETPTDVALEGVRLYAFGDVNLNNGREIAQFALKAKSPGSSTYDITATAFTPSHPYTILDPVNFLIYQQNFTTITSRFFRAEFVQNPGNPGFNGPRIVEIDAIGSAINNPPPPPPIDPPVIVAQPLSVVANVGMPVVLSVQATGAGTLQYQWFKDAAPLASETSSTLSIAALTSANAGVYSVNVTDTVGTTGSASASVSVDFVSILPGAFDLWDVQSGAGPTASTAIFPGSSANNMFGVGDSSNDSGTTYFAAGADGSIHIVEWATPAPVQVNAVRLFARALNDEGNAEFGSFTLKAKSPGSATFDIVVGTYTPTHPYTFLDVNTAAILDTEIAPVVASAFRAEFTQFVGGPRVFELDAYTSRPLVTPAVIVAPVSQTVARNGDVTLRVVARGGNLTYQWTLNGKNIVGATGDTLVITRFNNKDLGAYTVTITNPLGSVTSQPANLVLPPKK